jgi:histidinol-phosphate aminotransferase
MRKTSYAKENGSIKDTSGFMDCSNGINPFGISGRVLNSLKNFDVTKLNTYPKPALNLKNIIMEYWKGINVIDEDQIVLGDGSIELIYKINKLFVDNQSLVLGYSPQFSDYVDDVQANGGIYESYILEGSNNFRMDPEQFMDRMDRGHSLFYLDNPNNPTGQVIDVEDLEKIVTKAAEYDRPVIIDEAYGDFIPKELSAVSLVNKFNNLIVIRSLSKGIGLAGIRAGYIVTSKEIAEQYRKISNPYEMNSIARHLAEAAIQDTDFMTDCCEKIILIKGKFIKALSKLQVLETSESVPIMTLKHPDNGTDLEKLLLDQEIKSVSCKEFVGLGQNYVRLMINPDIDRLIAGVQRVEDQVK